MSDRYEVSVPEVLRVVAQLGGLTSDIGTTTAQLAGLAAPIAGYGVIGATAGARAGQAQAGLAAALAALEATLKLLNERVTKSATAYADGDREIAEDLARTVGDLPVMGR
ncbi:uncharacterized protein YukE [Catenuloplanes nepalensis]|uniref:Uncharacterized protein YukE n=1 Tax=Catenuloplanes nepalensis TaxID=587533 RepID=A0ABT9MRQ2_9ACTN|nr:type VII secretion target [Catenuloplanes nepalensis]MDP9794068.1 uncharacterized protein YukE [Catenuloplanes nepalensis]